MTQDRFKEFWDAQSEWSQATFGTDAERGPVGPLKHLEKEVQEALAEPDSLEEKVDCFFLVIDAVRRSGHTREELLNAAFAKLEINKQRVWPKQGSVAVGEAVEHVRDDSITNSSPDSTNLCVGCDIELSDKNGSLMDGSLRGTPHTCGKRV